MITVRRSADRGHINHGWLDTYHTFSFGEYRDLSQMGFRSLRVINEDRVAGGQGFGTHPHANMEILTYVLSGALEHKDSLGSGGVIRPGDIQRMSAGTGIAHSEFNASATESVHLLQIWLLPSKKEMPPGYAQVKRDVPLDDWCLLASPDGRDGSISMGCDALVWASRLSAGSESALPLAANRYGWLQVVSGDLDLSGFDLHAGDGASMEKVATPDLHAKTASHVLFFDLA